MNDFHIDVDEMPEFLKNIASNYFSDNPVIVAKLIQCSTFIKDRISATCKSWNNIKVLSLKGKKDGTTKGDNLR